MVNNIRPISNMGVVESVLVVTTGLVFAVTRLVGAFRVRLVLWLHRTQSRDGGAGGAHARRREKKEAG